MADRLADIRKSHPRCGEALAEKLRLPGYALPCDLCWLIAELERLQDAELECNVCGCALVCEPCSEPGA